MQRSFGYSSIFSSALLTAFAGISAFSCSSSADVEATDAAREALLGDALPGTDAATFATARAAFNATEVATDGAGQQIEARYGRLVNGLFDAMESTGGSLRQLFGIGGFNVGPLNCMSGTDANPAPQATIFAGRLTTPLFGLGLVDSLPDARFDALAQREAASIRGVVNRVSTVLPNPLDASQTTGATRVGRFGWKAGVGNLGQFSADAYLNEMGITTTSCIRGQ